GGPDPETNSKLRLAIINAKAQNMPKDNVETAIKRAAGRDAADISEVSYEGKAHGAMIFVDCATDNTNRTVVNLRTYFNKSGGELLDSGALQFMFQRKSVIEFTIPEGQDRDDVELGLMDFGLEEMEDGEESKILAYGEVSDFGTLTKGVEELGLELNKASLQRIPTSPVDLTEEQMAEVEKLLDKIEDDEDVQAVYTNIA
ncbi:MAG: YebC/PmpR family DNA-binding transcriptional regulator, partial [Verrucomicrobiota bacterium]